MHKREGGANGENPHPNSPWHQRRRAEQDAIMGGMIGGFAGANPDSDEFKQKFYARMNDFHVNEANRKDVGLNAHLTSHGEKYGSIKNAADMSVLADLMMHAHRVNKAHESDEIGDAAYHDSWAPAGSNYGMSFINHERSKHHEGIWPKD